MDPLSQFVNGIVSSLGIGTMNVIGAIVFVLATLVFIGELFNYRVFFTQPFIRKTTTKWDAMSLVTVGICAALFGGGLALTAGIVFVPGIAYLRPAQALTTVFGILFGIPGCIGSAVGNFIGDIFAGTLTLGSVAGFIGNFFSAYVPYRIIYTPEKAKLDTTGKILLYAWAVVAGGFVIAFYIPWWLAVLNIIPAQVAWIGVFGNIWLNGLITPWILGFILMKLLFPYTRRWNMYWADKENVEFPSDKPKAKASGA
jgi:energy-coupling factor transport system substrate-specific component